MIKRTTIEIDTDVLERARAALGQPTTRATVEEALRRAAAGAEGDRARRAESQRRYLERLPARADLRVLGSDRMWR